MGKLFKNDSWFDNAINYTYDTLKEFGHNVAKDPLTNLATLGVKGWVDTAEKKAADYQDANGGRQARGFIEKSNKEAAEVANTQAAAKVARDSEAAAARYGGTSGGGASDPFQSLTNTSLMNPNKKKSILGGF